VARWLGDIRRYFPSSVVSLMQRDAVERLGIERLLLEPELLSTLEPDIHLASTLVSLAKVIPDETRETARAVVAKVTRALEQRLRDRLSHAVRGALRGARTSRPRPRDIDWPRTIAKNLVHAIAIGDPARPVPVPQRLVGWRRRDTALKDVILCVDQSGSMTSSLVYASVMGAVLASLRTLRTRFIAFSTEVVDLSEQVHDPVELLFGAHLDGGTDIGGALGYCQGLIERPSDTVLVLISDLEEGGDPGVMLARAAELVRAGVRVVVLLALSDDGEPAFAADEARHMTALGIPCFACTPDRFAELMAAALAGTDSRGWRAIAHGPG
jgi:Mg-chelatase subunit ChlD